MHWIFPALTAPFINSAVNFIDKYLVSGKVRDYRAMPVYSAGVNFLLGTAVWVGGGFPLFDAGGLCFAFLSGFLLAIATAVYYYLIFREDTSDIVFLFSLTPFFVLAMAGPILGQSITAVQYAGFSLITGAVMLVSWTRPGGRRALLLTLILALLMDLLIAGSTITISLAVRGFSFWDVLTAQGWGMGLGGLMLLLLPGIATAVHENASAAGSGIFYVIFFNESLTVLYEWISYFALSVGPAALVNVVGGTRVFYAIVMGGILTLAFPKIFREDISRRNFLRKIAVGMLLFAGLCLVYA